MNDIPLSVVGLEDDHYVVTRYIDNPLLVDSLKFDLRLYVLVSNMNPLTVYLYQQGMVRFATEPYNPDPSTYDNQYNKYILLLFISFIHLTNYSVNKHSENFVDSMAEDEGSKWTLTALRDALKDNGIDDAKIFDQIEDIIIKSLLSVEDTVFPATPTNSSSSNCFELFGYDIIIDDDMTPWLLEVNMFPSLNVDSPFDLYIKGPLVADTFTLIGLQPYDPITGEKKPPGIIYIIIIII